VNEEKTDYDLFIVFSKEYFESSNIANYDENRILELIDKKSENVQQKDFTKYKIPHANILDKINYKNFNYIKKGSLLFISYEFQNGCNTHPHHIYVQFLSEVGIFGLFFLFVFYFFISKSLLIKILKFIKKGIVTNDVVLYGYFFTVFCPLMPSGNFFNNYYSILLYFPLTFVVLCHSQHK